MLDQPSPGISAIALCAGTGHWGMKGILFSTAPILPTFAASFVHCIKMLMVPCSVLCGTTTTGLSASVLQPSSTWLMTPTKTRPHKPMLEGRKESLQHPWQPTRLNGWNSVCSLLHSLCSTSCTNQTEEPCELPARCSTNITSQAIIAGQGSVYAHNHCHKEQSSTQQDKPPSGRALEMLQARPPADCVLMKGPLDKTQ